MAGKERTRGLGRGLDALFADQTPLMEEGSTDKEQGTDAVHYVDINDIKPNRAQPRKSFSPDRLKDLAASITAHGIIQPLVVRRAQTGYELVAGERRWRAAREAGLAKVPVLVREFDDRDNMLIAVIENMQREDLNPIEEAEGLQQLIKTYGLKQEEISRSVGKSRSYIANSIRLLQLPERIRGLLVEQKLTAGHGRAILALESKQKQEAAADRVIREGLSVRETEKLCGKEKRPTRKAVKRVKPASVLTIEQELQSLYGTKVSIDRFGNKGRISLEFYSVEELNRLIDRLREA